MIKQSRRFIPFRYWDYKYNPITGFKTHRKNELIFNKERESECKVIYYDKSINKRWSEEDKAKRDALVSGGDE